MYLLLPIRRWRCFFCSLGCTKIVAVWLCLHVFGHQWSLVCSPPDPWNLVTKHHGLWVLPCTCGRVLLWFYPSHSNILRTLSPHQAKSHSHHPIDIEGGPESQLFVEYQYSQTTNFEYIILTSSYSAHQSNKLCLELKSSWTFLAIKSYQWTKIVEVTDRQRSLLKSGRSWAPIAVKPLSLFSELKSDEIWCARCVFLHVCAASWYRESWCRGTSK